MKVARFICLTIGAALLLAPRLLSAQATTIPANDPVYRDVELLAGTGFTDGLLPATRPYSRRALARLVADARARIASAAADSGRVAVAERAIARIVRRAGLDVAGDTVVAPRRIAPLAAVDGEGAVLGSPARRVPFGGLGPIDAVTNPLAEHRAGRPLPDGATAALESEHVIEPTSWLAIDGRVRYAGSALRGGGSNVGVTVPTLYGRAVLRNVALEVGRQQLAWGPGRVAGLALSSNAPGLDLLRISNDLPFRLPWKLRALGPVSAQLFVSDLGAGYNFPHAKLAGYRTSVRPARWMEIAVDVLDVVGGRGAPAATAGEKIADFFPLIDVVFQPNRDYEFSNKLAGGDVRFALPARGAELYWEVLWDDFDARRLWSTMWQASAHEFGIRVPRLTSDGSLGASAELHHIGLHEYQHTQFTTGVTRHESILGDPLGPRGDALYLVLDWLPATRSRLSLDLAGERRSNDKWTVYEPNPNGAIFRFIKLQDLPEEWRHRAMLTWTLDVTPRLSIEGEGGVERATNFDFVKGVDRTNALARLAFRRTF